MEELEYVNVAHYCLNTINKSLRLFFETYHKDLILKEYQNSLSSCFDVIFYLNVLRDKYSQINFPSNNINLVYSLKMFRNKISHQFPISLRELYRFVDDTEILIDLIKSCDISEINNIKTARKQILKRMVDNDDNTIVIGINNKNNINFNHCGNNNSNDNLKDYNNFDEMDYDMDIMDDNEISKNQNYQKSNYVQEKENKINYNTYNIYNFYGNNGKVNNRNNSNNFTYYDEEKKRMDKINKNFEEIIGNKDNDNFMEVHQLKNKEFEDLNNQ